MDDKKQILSIVIPAYDEAGNLYRTLKDIADYFKGKNFDYEVIIVDDGSRDNTIQTALSAKPLLKSFFLLENGRNYGKGYSVKKGVLSAGGDIILFMDADNSTRIDQIEKLLNAINQGSDVAIASRDADGAEIIVSQPLHRRILGDIYIGLSNWILGVKIKDYNCGFKLYTRSAAKLLFGKSIRNDWSFDSELILLISKFKLKLSEVPVKWQDNPKTSKVNPLCDSVKSLLGLFEIKLRDICGMYRK